MDREQRLLDNIDKERFDKILFDIDFKKITNDKNCIKLLKQKYKDFVINKIDNQDIEFEIGSSYKISQYFDMDFNPTEIYEESLKLRTQKINEILNETKST